MGWEKLLNIIPSSCYLSFLLVSSISFDISLEGRRATINTNRFRKCDLKLKKPLVSE